LKPGHAVDNACLSSNGFPAMVTVKWHLLIPCREQVKTIKMPFPKDGRSVEIGGGRVPVHIYTPSQLEDPVLPFQYLSALVTEVRHLVSRQIAGGLSDASSVGQKMLLQRRRKRHGCIQRSDP